MDEGHVDCKDFKEVWHAGVTLEAGRTPCTTPAFLVSLAN
ncbi:hypothetical protein KNP414_00267 [Paenibacillus mucilaginosus KNP414]|uniref:Uncharacterized protein n=1 Tax=Paenibacillus mucilaginosus (strain KNP414) TaxID=1036673 RepID=F8FM84_PAEMK|nr:hypothetical protein KNP414_00267 [Paenibacillus mucilaginosus KNP414]